MNDYSLMVHIVDSGGRIIHGQPLHEFIGGKRDITIVNCYSGRKLFDILVDELGVIRFENNKLAFKYILNVSAIKTTMTLLGKIAEAVIVRNCKDNEDINNEWFSIARKRKAKLNTSKKFIAIGTGLKSTQENCRQKYNPSDTQRDIIWINPITKNCAFMKDSSKQEGSVAGVQIKVSQNGKSYILNDLLKSRYEVPVVYFGINNDFDKIVQNIYQQNKPIKIGEDFVNVNAIDTRSYDEVIGYFELVKALIDGKLKPEELVDVASNSNDNILKNAITSSTLDEVKIFNRIIH